MLRSAPQCAINQQERLNALRQEQEIEQLREFMVKFNILAPSQAKESKANPIRMEDLKELAKRWKLHQQSRNFWREHTERDDLLRALLNHLRLLKEQERQPVDTRPVAGINGGGKKGVGLLLQKEEASVTAREPQPPASYIQHLSPLFQWKKTNGDLFSQRGTYSDGIVYLSRIKLESTSPPSPSSAAARQRLDILKNALKESDPVLLAAGEVPSSTVLSAVSPLPSSADSLNHALALRLSLSAEDFPKEELVRRQFAESLYNLSCQPGVELKMIGEGVIEPLLDHNTQFRLIEAGGTGVLLQMFTSYQDRGPKIISLKALINLVSVPGGAFVETEILSMESLAKLQDEESIFTVSRATFNLSVLPHTRSLVVEEGIMGVLHILSKYETPVLQRELSNAVRNFSSLRSSQERMIKQGVLGIVHLLSSSSDHSVQTHIAAILAQFASNMKLGGDIAKAGFLPKLHELARKEEVEARRNVAIALANLSWAEKVRGKLVKENTPAVLMQLLGTSDIQVKTDSTIALCNLMTHVSDQSQMDEKIVDALVALADSESLQVQEVCSLALLNLSCAPSVRGALAVSQGMIGSLITLCAHENQAIQTRCITALYNISKEETSSRFIVESGGIPVVVEALNAMTKPPSSSSVASSSALYDSTLSTSPSKVFGGGEVVGAAEAAKALENEQQQLKGDMLLYLTSIIYQLSLSSTPSFRHELVDGGVIESIISLNQRAKGSLELKRMSASILANLSSTAMDHPGLIPTFLSLSHTVDEQTLLRISFSFALMSQKEEGRVLLAAEPQIIHTLISMMRSGFGEVQTHSAVCLCNLARERRKEEKEGEVPDNQDAYSIWADGTVQDFIVIAVLRVNSGNTKEMCARALYNLLCSPSLRPKRVEQGVVYALLKLARLESERTRELTLSALYKLSFYPSFVSKLFEIETVRFFYQIIDDNLSVELRRLMAHILCNMVAVKGHTETFIDQKGLKIVKLLGQLRDFEIRMSLASVLCNLSTEPTLAPVLVSEKFVHDIVIFGRMHDPTSRYYSAISLCNLSANSQLLSTLSDNEAISTMVSIMRQDPRPEVVRVGVRALRNFIQDQNNAARIVDCGAVEVLSSALSDTQDEETANTAATLLCILTEVPTPGLGPRIVKEGIVKALQSIAKLESEGSRRDVVYSLASLSQFPDTHELMVTDGVVEALQYLASPASLSSSTVSSSASSMTWAREIVSWASLTISNLSTTADSLHRAKLGSKYGLFTSLVGWAEMPNISMETRWNVAITLFNLSSVKKNTAQMVHARCVKTLINIVQVATGGAGGVGGGSKVGMEAGGLLGQQTTSLLRQLCAMTLNQISVDQPAGVMSDGLVSSLLSLMSMDKAAIELAESRARMLVRLPPLNSAAELYTPVSGALDRIRHPLKEVQWEELEEGMVSNSLSPVTIEARSISMRPAPPRQAKEEECCGSFIFMTETEMKCFLNRYRAESEQPSMDVTMGEFRPRTHGGGIDISPEANASPGVRKLQKTRLSLTLPTTGEGVEGSLGAGQESSPEALAIAMAAAAAGSPPGTAESGGDKKERRRSMASSGSGVKAAVGGGATNSENQRGAADTHKGAGTKRRSSGASGSGGGGTQGAGVVGGGESVTSARTTLSSSRSSAGSIQDMISQTAKAAEAQIRKNSVKLLGNYQTSLSPLASPSSSSSSSTSGASLLHNSGQQGRRNPGLLSPNPPPLSSYGAMALGHLGNQGSSRGLLLSSSERTNSQPSPSSQRGGAPGGVGGAGGDRGISWEQGYRRSENGSRSSKI